MLLSYGTKSRSRREPLRERFTPLRDAMRRKRQRKMVTGESQNTNRRGPCSRLGFYYDSGVRSAVVSIARHRAEHGHRRLKNGPRPRSRTLVSSVSCWRPPIGRAEDGRDAESRTRSCATPKRRAGTPTLRPDGGIVRICAETDRATSCRATVTPRSQK